MEETSQRSDVVGIGVERLLAETVPSFRFLTEMSGFSYDRDAPQGQILGVGVGGNCALLCLSLDQLIAQSRGYPRDDLVLVWRRSALSVSNSSAQRCAPVSVSMSCALVRMRLSVGWTEPSSA